MDSDTHRAAAIIPTRLCVGRSVCGVHFYADQPVLLLASYEGVRGTFAGPAEAYLNIEAGWQFAAAGSPSPTRTDRSSLPRRPLEELAAVACGIRKSPIAAVELAVEAPHLSLRFEDGSLLLVDGWDPKYEVWTIEAGDWSIYALEAGKITWAAHHPGIA